MAKDSGAQTYLESTLTQRCATASEAATPLEGTTACEAAESIEGTTASEAERVAGLAHSRARKAVARGASQSDAARSSRRLWSACLFGNCLAARRACRAPVPAVRPHTSARCPAHPAQHIYDRRSEPCTQHEEPELVATDRKKDYCTSDWCLSLETWAYLWIRGGELGTIGLEATCHTRAPTTLLTLIPS